MVGGPAGGVRERQASPDTLIAVSAASNRSKADKDRPSGCPRTALTTARTPRPGSAPSCGWDLAVDERQALLGLAEDCPTTVVYEPAL
ncbi:hypothetical protein [Streptomyces goshikiensis]|uniref:hypothetical protein n=1 Tax=Streptomyces goshikiensis TaxID=1942 RepID=UPI0033A7A943